MCDIKDNTDSWSDSDGSDGGGDNKNNNAGRWTKEEHDTFLLGLGLYGRDWKKVATAIKTRTPSQIRSHAQKYFQKLSRSPMLNDGSTPNLGEEDKDAFTVLEYLESTLKSLKRRRDELDCSVSTKASSIAELRIRKAQRDDADGSSEYDKSNLSGSSSSNEFCSNDAVDNNNETCRENGEDSTDSTNNKNNNNNNNNSNNTAQSELKLSKLHEEELIAVQVLCGSRHTESSNQSSRRLPKSDFEEDENDQTLNLGDGETETEASHSIEVSSGSGSD